MKPLVSVIIPVFRVEDYLDRCVESVVDQTYKNLEIILVDDGSDDNCPAMCDAWKEKDGRINVVHKKNGGLSDARNAGMKIMTGTYLYFLDSDDYIVNDAIEKLVDIMENDNVDALAFGYQKIDEEGKFIFSQKFNDITYHFENEQEKVDFISRFLLRYKLGWEAWNRFFKVSIIRENDLHFEPNKEIFAEDECFNLYYTLCSKSIKVCSEQLHYYLIRGTSIMGTQKELKINEITQLAKKVYELAKKRNMNFVCSHYDIIASGIIGHYILKIEEKEYEYYSKKISDKEFCKKSITGINNYLCICKVWGIKDGIGRCRRFKKFAKNLK